ncbi:extracellular solute-binding protein [Paenibacillus sp. PAMC21692]|uniref:extracellular solute-binding protein n=1 Tax=Paenibacillus sp. PAMC21692 TaxID=2762320 RepID=UPI00164D37A5|nr:extracellular solute-binding protein [Paenibacillus sp. PAMC21692]QNK58809.1 extracellular solute-binding protein [Paenibacillus sp. PAMC21692]
MKQVQRWKSRNIWVVAMMMGVMVWSSACSGNSNNNGDAVNKPDPSKDLVRTEEPAPTNDNGRLAEKDTKLQVLMEEHASYPVKPFADSLFLQHVKDKTGIELDIIPVPDSGDAYKQKLNIILNSKDLPDIIWNTKDDANINSLAVKGMFLPYDEYLDQLPNIKAALEKFPELRKTIAAEDGKLYIMPRLLFDNMTELFLFRKDVLEKEGLSPPATFDELYTVLKTLKDKYPDHIIWANRWGSEHILNRLAYSWGTGFEPATQGFYLNREQDRYVYGPTEPQFKEMVVWLKKLYDEGILDPEYALRTTQQWEEVFFSEKALFTVDFIARVQQVNNKFIEQNSSARIVAIAPPTGPTGRSGIYGRSSVLANSGIAVTAGTKHPLEAFKLIDWIFGGEGRYIARYGIEGETYSVNADDTVSLTPNMQSSGNPGGKELVKDYGWVYYLNKYEFPVDHMKAEDESDENLYMYSRKVMEDASGIVAPDPVLAYTEDQTKVVRNKGTVISDYFKENIDKFVMGARPISEWETFVGELQKRDTEEVAAIYNEAYQSYLSK